MRHDAPDAPDASDCAREPIHLSGAIQPHGYLVSCQVSDWTIRHVSANVGDLFDVAPGALLGETLREHVASEVLAAIADTVGYLDAGLPAQRVGTANLGIHGALCDRLEGVHEARPGRLVSLRDVALAVEYVDAGDGRLDVHAQCLYADAAGAQYAFRVEQAGRVLASGRAAVIHPVT